MSYYPYDIFPNEQENDIKKGFYDKAQIKNNNINY